MNYFSSDTVKAAQSLLKRLDEIEAAIALKDRKALAKKLLASERKASVAIWKRSKSKRQKQFDTSSIPANLRWITDEFIDELRTLTERLHSFEITNADWEDEFQILLARYSQAGYMAGANSATPSTVALDMMTDFLDGQFSWLSDFRAEIQDEEEWQEGWTTRAESYALSIKVPYWNGEIKMLPLPAMPAQGTQCLNNCGCSWRIETIDEGKGDYDCYWERSKDDSCQTCLEREAQWSPIEIRGGMLQ